MPLMFKGEELRFAGGRSATVSNAFVRKAAALAHFRGFYKKGWGQILSLNEPKRFAMDDGVRAGEEDTAENSQQSCTIP